MNDIKKASLLLAISLCLTMFCSAQHVVINSRYEPLTREELYLEALAKKAEQERKGKIFDEYKEKADELLYKYDYEGFIFYAKKANKVGGWYSAKMDYDMGQVYEYLHKWRKARKAYKKALKEDYYQAQKALDGLSERKRLWENSRK